MGARISTVAVLLMSWLSTSVSTHSTASATYAPESPITESSQPAMRSAVPVTVNAVDSGIMPAISTTVVHEIER